MHKIRLLNINTYQPINQVGLFRVRGAGKDGRKHHK